MTIKYYGVIVALYSWNKEDDHLYPEIIQCLRNLTRIQGMERSLKWKEEGEVTCRRAPVAYVNENESLKNCNV